MNDKHIRGQLSKVTQIIIDTVANAWKPQSKNQDTINLTPGASHSKPTNCACESSMRRFHAATNKRNR